MTRLRTLKGLLLFLSLAGTAHLQAQTPNVSATQSDAFTPNSAGRATPGNNVTYSIQINNTGAAAANGVTLTNPTPANTTLVPGSLRTTCLAFDDTYACLGNVSITIAAPGVLANDVDPDNVGPALTATPIVAGATTQGGTVTLNADGSFTYNPPAGYVGADSFTYTLNDNDDVPTTDTATVTINVSGMIWFINANAGTNGDGRLSSPFNNLASFQAINDGVGNHPKAGQSIFLYESANDYTGGIALLGAAGGGQRLIGQDATSTLATLAGVAPPPGSAPLPAMNSANGVVARIVNSGGNGVTMGLNSRIHGFTAGNASGNAVNIVSAGTVLVSDVSINTNGNGLSAATSTFDAASTFISTTSSGGDFGVSLANVAGTVNLGSGALSGHSQSAFSASGAVSVSYSGSITKASGIGSAVLIDSKSGTNTVALSGAISATGVAGVTMTGNSAGTTVNLSGGVTISSGANAAFTATGGGTINVTGSNNTLASTTGRALNITSTNIGGSGVAFRSISANGAINGIVLNNTGSTGGLTVTGSGSTAVGGNSSGGTIQGTSGPGILLNNTRNVSLTNVTIQNTADSGIDGTLVTNFTFANGTINNSGTSQQAFTSNIDFNDDNASLINQIAGTFTVTNSVLSNAYYCGVDIQNYSGVISSLTISGNTITSSTSTATSKAPGIRVLAFGGADITTATINGNTVTNFPSDAGIMVQGGNAVEGGDPGNLGVLNSPTDIIAITNNIVSGQSAANRMGTQGILFNLNGTGNGNFNVSGNQVSHTFGNSISHNVFGDAVVTTTISNNTVISNNTLGARGIAGGVGIASGFATNTPSLTATINNNQVSQTDGNGIAFLASENITSNTDWEMTLKIIDNTVAAPLTGFRPGIIVNAGGAAGDNDVRLRISGNTSAGTVSTSTPGIGLRKQGTDPSVNAYAIEGLSPSPNTAGSQVINHVNALNPAGNGTLLVSAETGFTNAVVPLLFTAEEPGATRTEIAPPMQVVAEQGSRADQLPPSPDFAAVSASSFPLITSSEASRTPALDQTQLNLVVADARARWNAAGLSEEQSALLDHIHVELADLPDLHLGETFGDSIRIDTRAGGNGWYTGSGPESDAHFAKVQAETRWQVGEADSPAAGRVDLLTTLMHEMGHVLGLSDSYSLRDRNSVMYGHLVRGERRLPRKGEAAGAIPHAQAIPQYLSAPVTIGTLPPGKSITVTFQVTVNTTPATFTSVSSQGTISGDNFANVLTDDPDVAGPANPTVTPVEQPPVLTDANFVTNEDTTLTFAAASFDSSFSDPNAGDTLTGIRITSLPGTGELRLNSVAITATPTDVPRASLGLLTYVPAQDVNGSASFGWNATDGRGYAASAATANITITAVNDAPTLDAIANPSAILEDAAEQTVNLTGISAGPANESSQTLTVTAESSNTGLIPHPVVTYTSPDATGSLSYTPVANAFGSAIITVRVQDNGGTANGGVNQVERQFTVVVNPVADTPSITNTTTLPATQTTSGLVISRNPVDGAEVTHYQITNILNGSLFQNDGTTAISAGSFITHAQGAAGLKFTPAPGFQGDASFDVQASTSAAAGGLGGAVITAIIAVNEEVAIATLNPGDNTAEEGGVNNGLFTFTRGGSTGVLVANFALDPSSTASASDFILGGGAVTYDAVAGTGTVTFPDGQSSVQVTLSAVAEPLQTAEPDETVRFNVAPVPGAYLAGTPNNATVTITQNGFLVTTTGDSGEGSLRQAVLNANAIAGADTITFSDGTDGTVDFTDDTADTITLTTGELAITESLSIAGPSPALLTIQRSTAGGTPQFRLFNISNAGTVSLSGLTIANGSTLSAAQKGGGLLMADTTVSIENCVIRDHEAGNYGGGFAFLSGSLTVRKSVIHDNRTNDVGGGFVIESGAFVMLDSTSRNNQCNNAGAGGLLFGGNSHLVNCSIVSNQSQGGAGGIFVLSGTAEIINSTISGNTTLAGDAGGVYRQGGTLTILQSTIADNSASGSGGGIANDAATAVSVGNSIVAANQAGGAGPDVAGLFDDLGGNLIGILDGSTGFTTSTLVGTGASPINPLLGPLADNGGPTDTLALLAGSPALNAGIPANIPADTFDLDGNSNTTEPIPFDQRGPGFLRAIGTVDIGAYELQKAVSITPLAASLPEGTGAGTTAFTFTVSRTGDTTGDVTMDYAVTGSGANPANAADFGGTLPSGQITINDGDSSTILTIQVSRDALAELDETFIVTLSNPDNGFIVTGTPATGTILNDDLLTVTLNQAAGQLDPTNTSPVNFTVVFSEPVTGFATGDVSLTGTAGATTGTVTEVAPNDGTTFSVAVTGMTQTGTVIATIQAAMALSAGNAGNEASTSTDNTVTYDITAPTAGVVVANTALSIGATSPVTFTFSEPVIGFTNADLSVANGALSTVASADGGITWTATLTPAANVEDASNVITLDLTGVSDLAGNAGVGTTNSNNYAIDTLRPTAFIVVADTALRIGETTTVTITFSEAVSGLSTGDFTVANGSLSGLGSSDGGITWTATLTPAANVQDATNLVTLDNTGVVDAAGNTGSGTTDSNNYAIDTLRPTVTIVVADDLLTIGETSLVTLTFSEPVTGLTLADLTVPNAALTAPASTDGGITWTATLTPNPVIAPSNVITINNAGVTDAAGNTGSGTTDSNNYAIDITTVSITAPDDQADENTGGTGTWRVSRNGSVGDLTVNLLIDAASTAEAADWTQSGASFSSRAPGSTGTVVIPDGSTFADITLTPVDDIHAEADETVRLHVTASPAYVLESPTDATITIGQNDFVVINTNDSGEGSLRQAIANANALTGEDTITFAGPVFTDATADTITLAAELHITSTMTIQGPSAARLSISGGGAVPCVYISGQTFTATLADLDIINGLHATTAGGIHIVDQQSQSLQVIVLRCAISHSSGPVAGGIMNTNGVLRLINSTVSGNTATGTGFAAVSGGVLCSNATLQLINSTISGNTVVNGGNTTAAGGVNVTSTVSDLRNATITANTVTASSGASASGFLAGESGLLTIGNSIVAGNANSSFPDMELYEAVMPVPRTTLGGNLVGHVSDNWIISAPSDLYGTAALPVDPLLGPLANNGGPTMTHTPLNGSPAINRGLLANLPADTYDLDGNSNTTEALPVDQRGLPNIRVRGPAPDSGAVEAFAFEPTILAASTHEDEMTASGLVVSANTADGGLTTHYQITGIRNGVLYQNDGATEISDGDFITVAEGAAGLKFLPGADLHDLNTGSGFGFTVQAAVGTELDDLRGETVTTDIPVAPVADIPGVTGAVTIVNEQTTDGLVITVNPVDGSEVTHFRIDQISDGSVFLNDGVTSVAEGSYITVAQGAAGLKFSPALNFIGIASFEARGATNSSGDGLGIAALVEINVNHPQPVVEVLGGGPVLNLRTGLFEHLVRVSNTSSVPMTGFRLTVVNMPQDLELWNRTHPVLPVIEDFNELPPMSHRDVLVAYYNKGRELPLWTPEYRVENLSAMPPELSGDVSGTYHGWIGRDDEAFLSPVPLLGARLTLKVNARGTFTGSLLAGKTRRALKGRLVVGPDDLVRPLLQVAVPNSNLTLKVIFDSASNTLIGFLEAAGGSGPGARATGWRNVWRTKAPANLPSMFLARHHFMLANLDSASGDQGFGFGHVRPLGRAGRCTVVTRLADGVAFTGSTFFGPDGQVLVYKSLYKHKGSCLGTVDLMLTGSNPPFDNTVCGEMSWLKPATASASGFGPVDLEIDGAVYTPPSPGQLVMGLLPTSPGTANAGLSFSLGALFAASQEFDQGVTVSSAGPNSRSNRVRVPLPNANRVVITSFNAANGTFAGTFSIPGLPGGKGSFRGQIVPAVHYGTSGFGYYLLPGGNGRLELLPPP